MLRPPPLTHPLGHFLTPSFICPLQRLPFFQRRLSVTQSPERLFLRPFLVAELPASPVSLSELLALLLVDSLVQKEEALQPVPHLLSHSAALMLTQSPPLPFTPTLACLLSQSPQTLFILPATNTCQVL